jgi:hypothetical protein
LECFEKKFKSGRDAILKKDDIAEWLSSPCQEIDDSLVGPLDWKTGPWMTPLEAKIKNTYRRFVSKDPFDNKNYLYTDRDC